MIRFHIMFLVLFSAVGGLVSIVKKYQENGHCLNNNLTEINALSSDNSECQWYL